MDVFVALHSAAALLLLVAGLAKVTRPGPTTELLDSIGVPAREWASRAIGGIESGVGIAALAVGGPITAAVTGAFYVGFVIVIVLALRTGAASCGCFGRVDAPPSWIHVLGNIVLATVSFVAIGGDTAIEVMDGQPAAGVGFVLLIGVLAGLALVVFTALPEALSARHPGSGASAAPFRMNVDEDPS